MSDPIDRQAVLSIIRMAMPEETSGSLLYQSIKQLPAIDTEPEQHYCRECKWSWCHINVGKHGEVETYWHCLNWDGGTDEEGFCHEWERRTDERVD